MVSLLPGSSKKIREMGRDRKMCNVSVMGSSNTNVPFIIPLFGLQPIGLLARREKRGKGRFSQHNFKIPLYPPEAVKKFSCSGVWGY
jgi:hypothetical protein